ncbi:hypothetical protein PybrP1_011521 [[Pythium] brassicae (nom. inval.)]|nr:hypothetical protein PybrP1_011521 [[Pythium] brassicae (nom. inval.)]
MGAGSSAQRNASDEQPAAKEELVLNELKVETGDQNAVKNMLDDAVSEFFEEKAEYTILFGRDNVKMLLMVLAILVAAVSHFYKSPAIPEHVIVYSSVGSFFLIHALLLGYNVFVEKDTILRLSKKGAGSQVLLVRTSFPYTEENYTIILQHEGAPEKQRVKVELYVGRFFDSDGFFSKDALVKDLETVLARFQKAKKTQ